jgi:hypothetical protein
LKSHIRPKRTGRSAPWRSPPPVAEAPRFVANPTTDRLEPTGGAGTNPARP